MKTAGALLLLVTAASLLFPLNPVLQHPVLQGHSRKNKAVIFTLDLCNHPCQPLSAHSDMPSLFEHSEGFVSLSLAGSYEAGTPEKIAFLIVLPEEHPPKLS